MKKFTIIIFIFINLSNLNAKETTTL